MQRPAVILLVRFRSYLSKDRVLRVAEDRAPKFRAVTGVAQEHYLEAMEGDEYASLHLRESAGAMGEFAESELRVGIEDARQMDGEPPAGADRVLVPLRG